MNSLKYLLLLTFLGVGVTNSFAEQDDSQDSSQDKAQVTTDNEPISQAQLEQILAPIALYPDTVLAHILVAATYPLEVIQAERWVRNNLDLSGSDAVEAVNDKDWDPSVRALVAFPQILKRLSQDLDWTQQLGDAFLQDEEQLLASVQSLRQRAYDAGSLEDMEKVSVTHEGEAILIEPREREVVYLPYYDTRVVYGPWHWAHHQPVYWDYPYGDHYYARRRHSPFYWGPRIDISFGFFFSSFHWGNHHLVRIPYNHYRPRQYYNHHQIVRHHNSRRWAHNPRHRRGVAYRHSSVRDRFPHRRYDQHLTGGKPHPNRVTPNRVTNHRAINSRATNTNSQNSANVRNRNNHDRVSQELRERRRNMPDVRIRERRGDTHNRTVKPRTAVAPRPVVNNNQAAPRVASQRAPVRALPQPSQTRPSQNTRPSYRANTAGNQQRAAPPSTPRQTTKPVPQRPAEVGRPQSRPKSSNARPKNTVRGRNRVQPR